MIALVPTTKLHTVQLGCWMRSADAGECLALGMGSIEAAFESWRASHLSTTMLLDGEVVACAGLVLGSSSALGPRQARAWVLTSKLVDYVPLAFHRAALTWLKQARTHADVLWNHVDARYLVSLRWLERLGFSVHPARPRGPLELPFHLVTLESP